MSPDGGIWTGPLDALLDAWTGPSGYEWRFKADRREIEIVRSRSAVFHIHALAGTQRYTVSSSTQDSAAGDGGSGNLTSQTISTETDYDPWPEIEGQLRELLDPGTRLSVAPSSASVTVSGTPHDIARARAYLGYLNREVLRPVTLSVHVYSVRVEREADYDLRLELLDRPPAWRRAARQRGVQRGGADQALSRRPERRYAVGDGKGVEQRARSRGYCRPISRR